MMRKKLDTRFKTLIENGIANNHRSMFVIVGDKGKDLVPIVHTMLSKATVKARPTVLWAYKKELDLSSNRKKRMKQIQKKIKSGLLQPNEDDPFEQFVACTQIRHCFYKDTHKILGNTFGMCVLQDFEALTPNLLARTVETVEGGGLVVILLRTMTSLRQLHTMVMDVHARYRTESHQDVVGRFNERFLLSLSDCSNCLVIDDQLNILPISSKTRQMTPIPPKPMDEALSGDQLELKRLKQQLLEEKETQLIAAVIGCCVTLDQAKAVLRFVEGIVDKSLRSTVVMTAARGRGKSASLGLGMACAVAYGYSNIYVTAPSPENLKTMYEFICKGFDALKYEEHQDYELVQSDNAEFNKAIVRINVCREHRQTIQYIHPTEAHKLSQAELVCIDEAAAIPLPLVKSLLGSYLVFMSSTINGYEGTGRSLSLKLISNLREKSNCSTGGASQLNVQKLIEKLKGKPRAGSSVLTPGRSLYELTLSESIRYHGGDPVEKWLTDLLCLDVSDVTRTSYECVAPSRCELIYVNRDTLFSYHRAAELFLRRLVSIYVASHYKNTPDDLQLLSDAPAHHIFCLIRPVPPDSKELPDIYCVIQVCLEGQISKDSIENSLRRGQRASGDLIPWTISEQFQDSDFASLSGARIVRIATHPDMQRMGYGKRAMELLQQYYEHKIPCMGEELKTAQAPTTIDKSDSLLEEQISPRQNLPPLLQLLSNRPPEHLDYMGVSFGLTAELLKFWKNFGMAPVYLRQTANELTGEHSCIMLKRLNVEDDEDGDQGSTDNNWLLAFWKDFRRRFVSLLSYDCFRQYRPQLALEMLHQKQFKENQNSLSAEELSNVLTGFDLNRLDKYASNMVDYHLVVDLVPTLAHLYFLNRLNVNLKAVQSALLVGIGLQHKAVDTLRVELDTQDGDLKALLVGIGLQHKTVDTLRVELDTQDGDLKVSQLLAWFNQLIRILLQTLRTIQDRSIESGMVERREIVMEPIRQSMNDDLAEGARDADAKIKGVTSFKDSDLSQYAIKGSEEAWSAALKDGASGIVSIAGKDKKRKLVDRIKDEKNAEKQKNKKFKKHHGDKKKKFN